MPNNLLTNPNQNIKSREVIEAQLVSEMVIEQTEVTDFEPKSPIRGFITAIAGVIRELWHDLYQEMRKWYLDTSYGESLDNLAGERGLTRQGASRAGVPIIFEGTSGTVIPAGTRIYNPSNGMGYLTNDEMILGTTNPDFVISGSIGSKDITLSDTVWAECEQAGTIGNCQAGTIKGIPAIVGIVSVTNPVPATGGDDIESDGHFRNRIRNQISILNQGTQAAYEQWAKEADTRVLRVRARRDLDRSNGVVLTLVNSNGVPFKKSELNYIAGYVETKHRAFSKVTCLNISFTMISVAERVKLNGINLSTAFSRTADALAKYFNWKNWEFGGSVSIDDVFLVCKGVIGVDDIELNTFKINGGSPQNASTTQTLHNQTATASTTSSITDSAAVFVASALIGKYVKITSGTGKGQTRLIIGNTTTQISIQGVWDITPPIASLYSVVELYFYTSRISLSINNDSLPYFFGLDITDISVPSAPARKQTENIRIKHINSNQQQQD